MCVCVVPKVKHGKIIISNLYISWTVLQLWKVLKKASQGHPLTMLCGIIHQMLPFVTFMKVIIVFFWMDRNQQVYNEALYYVFENIKMLVHWLLIKSAWWDLMLDSNQ